MNLPQLLRRSKPTKGANGAFEPVDIDEQALFKDEKLLNAVLDQLEWSATDSPNDLRDRAAALDKVIAEASRN